MLKEKKSGSPSLHEGKLIISCNLCLLFSLKMADVYINFVAMSSIYGNTDKIIKLYPASFKWFCSAHNYFGESWPSS